MFACVDKGLAPHVRPSATPWLLTISAKSEKRCSKLSQTNVLDLQPTEVATVGQQDLWMGEEEAQC